MCKPAFALLAIVSAASQAFPALADGTITGLTLNPPSVKTCVAEAITINGTGQCANLTVDFGDGHKVTHMPLGGHRIGLPVTYYHRYAKPGVIRCGRKHPRPVQQMSGRGKC